jgi:hypothetical protein
MTVFGSVIDLRAGLDEDVLDVSQFGHLGLRRRIATQLVGHNLARCLSTDRRRATTGEARRATSEILPQDAMWCRACDATLSHGVRSTHRTYRTSVGPFRRWR